MAKLTGPLFSLGASGKIADTLVYLPWKGLNNVRKYVVPANPNTTPQQTQRGYLTQAVANIHGAEADALHPMNEADKLAYALLGSCEPTPRTWFNTIVKQWIDQRRAVLDAGVFFYSSISQGALTITLDIWLNATNNPTACKIYWGTSKTALINSATMAFIAGDHWNGDCSALTPGVKYYFQIRATAPATRIGMNTGIYHAIKT